MASEYIAKIKVPKNCYFCKHLETETTDDEYMSDSYYVCNREPEVKNTCGDKFEKNMKWHKRCFKPITDISVHWYKSVKVLIK